MYVICKRNDDVVVNPVRHMSCIQLKLVLHRITLRMYIYNNTFFEMALDIPSIFYQTEDVNMKNYLEISFIACITNLCKSHWGILWLYTFSPCGARKKMEKKKSVKQNK